MESLVGIFGTLTVLFLIILAVLTFLMPFIIYAILKHSRATRLAAESVKDNTDYLVMLAKALYVEED